MKQKKIPLRKCTGCNEMKPKKELVRIVRLPDKCDDNGEVMEKGNIELDFTGKKPGRGAYVCRNVECLKKARKTKSLERKFEAQVSSEIYDSLEQAFIALPPVSEDEDE